MRRHFREDRNQSGKGWGFKWGAALIAALALTLCLPMSAAARALSVAHCPTSGPSSFVSYNSDGSLYDSGSEIYTDDRYAALYQGSGVFKRGESTDPSLRLSVETWHPNNAPSVCVNCGITPMAAGPGSYVSDYPGERPEDFGSVSGATSASVKIFLGQKVISLGSVKPRWVKNSERGFPDKKWGASRNLAMLNLRGEREPTEWALDFSYAKHLKKIKKFQGKKRRVRVQLKYTYPAVSTTRLLYTYDSEFDRDYLEVKTDDRLGGVTCTGTKTAVRLPVKFRKG